MFHGGSFHVALSIVAPGDVTTLNAEQTNANNATPWMCCFSLREHVVISGPICSLHLLALLVAK